MLKRTSSWAKVSMRRADRIIPVGHAHDTAMPASSRLVVFEESGHLPHHEEPQRFVEALRDFLDTTEPVHLDGPEWRAFWRPGPPA
jgi:hypothetical protein